MTAVIITVVDKFPELRHQEKADAKSAGPAAIGSVKSLMGRAHC